MKALSLERTARAPFVPQMRLYTRWLEQNRHLQFADYNALWRWSVPAADQFARETADRASYRSSVNS
jgi:acetoacetyl-CoA synthetase